MSVTTRLKCSCLAAGLALSSSMANAEGTVTTRFIVDSTFFKSALPAEVIDAAELAVSQALADAASPHFRYLTWQSFSAGSNAEPQLILRLIEQGGGACAPTPTVKLVWSANVAGTERVLGSVAPHDLYLTCDPDLPTQEPDRLRADIIAAATDLLGNDAVRQRISDQVLKRVPIADQLINHANVMLLLPVAPDQLAADEDSEMVAKFDFSGGLPGDIVVRPRSAFQGSVQLLLMAVNVPTVNANLPADGKLWDDVLLQVLAGSSNLQVYMVDYIPSPFAGDVVGDTDVLSEL